VKALVAAAVIAGAAPAGAQPADSASRAKEADASARAHYDLREYEAAIEDYRRAFEAHPDPLFLFDIAQAYRQLHDCDNARVFYRNYLRNLPAADNRARVEQFIVEMDACVRHAAEPTRAVSITPPPVLGRLRLAGIITGIAGLAVVGGGVYFSFDAAAHAHQLELQCAQGCDAADVASIDRGGKDANQYAIASYVVGGAAITAGVVMVVWGSAHAQPMIVAPRPGGATVSAIVRF